MRPRGFRRTAACNALAARRQTVESHGDALSGASYGRRTRHPQQNTENLYFGDKEGGTPLIVT